MVRSIAGLERAVILQHGYAVEYDYVPPQQTRPPWSASISPVCFLAGQINGTSGYEEAAGQGLIAGLNAALGILVRESLVLSRDQAYIGVHDRRPRHPRDRSSRIACSPRGPNTA